MQAGAGAAILVAAGMDADEAIAFGVAAQGLVVAAGAICLAAMAAWHAHGRLRSLLPGLTLDWPRCGRESRSGFSSCVGLAAALGVADLIVKSTLATPPWDFHQRSGAWVALSAVLLVAALALAFVPSSARSRSRPV